MQHRGWITAGAVLVLLLIAVLTAVMVSGFGDETEPMVEAEQLEQPGPDPQRRAAPTRSGTRFPPSHTGGETEQEDSLEMTLEWSKQPVVEETDTALEDSEGRDPNAEAEEPGGEPPTLWPATDDGINEVVRENISDVRECYDQWLQVSPDLGGKVVVTFTISGQGADPSRISSAELAESEVEHALMEGCLLNIVDGFTFEPLDEGEAVEVTYPFMFRSE